MSARSLIIEKSSRPGVFLLRFDVPGSAVNSLRKEFSDELHEALDRLKKTEGLVAVVFVSGKPEHFIAGADLEMLEGASDPLVIETLSRIGQKALEEMERYPVPIVAAIGGACLGGGLELALACRARVTSDSPKVKLGLPEVQLGLLPGMGGTQRLVRLIGLESSLDLILTGKQLDGRRAERLGLVDRVVPASELERRAIDLAVELAETTPKKGLKASFLKTTRASALRELLLAENPLGRRFVFQKAREGVLKKTFGNYPAPLRILDVVRAGLERGPRAGYEEESKAFGELAVTPQSTALRHVFFAEQAAKKKWGAPESHKAITRISVIGAGLMGAGIAGTSVQRDDEFLVRLRDIDEAKLQAGLRHIRKNFEEQVQRGRMTERQRDTLLCRVTRSTDARGLVGQELVIEAVFEDLSLKRKVLREAEEVLSDEAIFASNTSAIPISSIAQEARHPQRVLGMHYFSPVEKMPLLEIVKTSRTSERAIESAVEVGRRQGKTVIVVGDGPGFYTTRILAPYLNEAAFLLLEGNSVESIDRALVQAGFPVGPLTLLDEIGIDVGAKVSEILHSAFGERMLAPEALLRLVKGGRLGRKSGRGFYRYESGKRSESADGELYAELGLTPADRHDDARASERCLLAMVNEAQHCLDEGILDSASDGDVGAIFGLGFPPFLGGPFHYLQREGNAAIVERLRTLERKFGSRFSPAKGLVSSLA